MFEGLGAAGGLAGGILGNIMAGGDQDKATAAIQAALAGLQGVDVPTVDEMKVALQNYQLAGTYNPILDQIMKANPTAFNNISIDPRLKNAQLQALQSLQDQSHMGLSASDRQALTQVRNQSAGEAEAANKAIIQNLAQRGMGGGGMELAARLSASQNANNQASASGDRIAAMAQQNALQALAQSGALGGQIRGQDYQAASDAARANDYINQFNTQNAQAVTNRNTDTQNQGQMYNLNNKQSISNANTGVSNQQELHNKGLYQQVFDDQMKKAGALAQQQNTNSGYYGQQAANTRGMWSGIGTNVGNMYSGYADYSNKQGAKSDGGTSYEPDTIGNGAAGGMASAPAMAGEADYGSLFASGAPLMFG